MHKDELMAYAADKGVNVTHSMTKKTIAETLVAAGFNLPEALADELALDKPVPLRLLRDFWDDVGLRHRRGDAVKVDVETAKRLISAGKAERDDPLPGEG